ncbi:MAG TPA: M20 family metallopeptidase [Pyrinomonadaceae bacterium]|nr:M20 family metallopeptidase [Pyrinomonadaceae bacterium]
MELSASNLQSLRKHFAVRQDDILALTRALIENESPSGDYAGSVSVVALLSRALQSIPGARVEVFPVADFGQHLCVTIAGPTDAKPIMLLGHTDTVHPRGSIDERPWRPEGNRIHGPGIFDMKANCALAVEVLATCVKHQVHSRHSLMMLLTCDEETGSPTGRALVEQYARNAQVVLVIEPPAAGGLIKTGRKGTGMFSIAAHGIAAHAGLEPEKGASAILELARQTEYLHSLNGKWDGTTVNVGVFHGGTLSNVVAAEARAEVDVRFTSATGAAKVEQAIQAIRPLDQRVELTISGGINRPPLERTDAVLNLYQKARQVAELIGLELKETQVGGASDGNFVSALGVPVLDGLGIDGDGAHALHEHIIPDDIPGRGALLTGLIAAV